MHRLGWQVEGCLGVLVEVVRKQERESVRRCCGGVGFKDGNGKSTRNDLSCCCLRQALSVLEMGGTNHHKPRLEVTAWTRYDNIKMRKAATFGWSLREDGSG